MILLFLGMPSQHKTTARFCFIGITSETIAYIRVSWSCMDHMLYSDDPQLLRVTVESAAGGYIPSPQDPGRWQLSCPFGRSGERGA